MIIILSILERLDSFSQDCMRDPGFGESPPQRVVSKKRMNNVSPFVPSSLSCPYFTLSLCVRLTSASPATGNAVVKPNLPVSYNAREAKLAASVYILGAFWASCFIWIHIQLLKDV